MTHELFIGLADSRRVLTWSQDRARLKAGVTMTERRRLSCLTDRRQMRRAEMFSNMPVRSRHVSALSG
jgi:hypothetical protein